ncbi:MAG: GNAT family N-acetyltransferase [Flavitalea sp.]
MDYPELSNELLLLRLLGPGDFDKLYKVASDPAIWAIHPSPDRYKREVFQVFFDGAVASESAYLVYDRKSNELIGSSRYYDFKPGESSIAIGYTFLATKVWGGYYNFSLKSLMLEYAFRFVDNVIFHIGAANIRSQKALLKLGAVKTRDLSFETDGKPTPHYEYVITREAWEQVKLRH